MIESTINRRYQSAAEVLKELNSQTPPMLASQQTPIASTAPSPVTSHPPISPSKSKIDDELAELKSQFLGTPAPKNPSQKPASQSASPSSPPKSKSQIDRELEDIKSQFLGSANPKKSPDHS
jgi:uncharacterized membrane protein